MLELRNLCKSFFKDHAPLEVLNNITLSIAKGEFFAVQGPSGSGKTTLLLSSGGLLRPDKGQVLINGQNVYDLTPNDRAGFRARNVGFVFQQYHLIPYLTALENVLTPNLAQHRDDSSKRGLELIEYLGLHHRVNHLPAELSAGEKQRIALARALIFQPKILFADEITGNLDEKNATLVLEYVKDFAKNGGTVMMVTHNSQVARQADRKFLLNPENLKQG